MQSFILRVAKSFSCDVGIEIPSFDELASFLVEHGEIVWMGKGLFVQFALFPKLNQFLEHVLFPSYRDLMWNSCRKATAGPSTPFGAKNALNSAQDDRVVMMRNI